MNLRFRLFLAFLALIIIVAISLSWVASSRTRTAFDAYADSSLRRSGDSYASFLEQRITEDGVRAAPAFLDRMAQTTGRDIFLFDAEAKGLYRTNLPKKSNERRPPPLAFQLRGDESNWQVTFVQMPRNGAGNSKLPAPELNELIQTANLDENEQIFLSSVNSAFLWAALLAIAVAGIASLSLAQYILNPIQSLTAAARKMRGGDLSQRVDINREDEIGKLGLAFNEMAGSLEKQELLRRNMVSDIAHELRTPLTNIRGYLEAIQDGLVSPDQKAIVSIHEEAMLLNHLVEDLQELSLAEAGQLRMDMRPIDLMEVVDKAIAAHQMPAQAKSIAIKASTNRQMPAVRGDAERLGQVARNILKNAILYTPTGGTIWVEATHDQKSAIIEVVDSGDGIDPPDLPYLFDRFYRADKARRRGTGGAGLGLAIAKAIVELHDGQIEGYNVPNRGAGFKIRLPLAQ